jgi:lipooligosaccharide transport system ATP-binding protein
MIVIRIEALEKRYGSFVAVGGVDLEVRAGECVGLLGPNGAGKTTIVRVLLGLSHPTAGKIEVLGHSIPAEARTMRARVGVVPQLDNLDPDFTVRENLQVYARYFGARNGDVEARVDALLRFAALESRADSPIATLSGGMKRRLTIARALVADPRLLFLDEPTTGLDPQARHLIWRRLRELRAEGRTLVLTTHYMEEAERLCDRVLVLDRGLVLDSGSPSELIARHIEPYVVEVSGDAPAIERAAAERHRADRFEQVGESAFFYARQPEAILGALSGLPDLRVVHRPASLEDVFLRLTGRELRDE